MTNKPKQKKPPAPKKGKAKDKAKKPKAKRVYQIGVFTILFLIMLSVTILTFTPLYSVIFSFVPESYQKIITNKLHQNIILDTSNKELSEPFKYEPSEPLPVLGDRSGICFYFRSSEAGNKLIINARKGKKIAEIIAVNDHKTEYKLKSTNLTKVLEDNYNASVVCQTFGRDYPSTPDIIKRIYVRPLKPFTPYKVMWITKKTFYTD